MKLYRSHQLIETDRKQPSDYIEDWKSGGRIPLDGTKSTRARRWTYLQLEIEDEDVIELFHALIERYQETGAPSWKTLAACAEPLSRLATSCRTLVETEKQR